MSLPRLSVRPTLPPGVYLRPAHDPLPYPLAEEACRIYARARHAIFHGVRQLGLRPGDEALVPAYHHGSEIEALVRAGATPRFYDCDRRLAPDPDRLDALLTPSTRALHLTHFLGFPQDAAAWRAWCDEHGLLLIEDAAQAWLSEDERGPVGSLGDLAVFCLFKTVGVPEGAALISTAPPPPPPLDPRWGVAEVARRHGAWLAERQPLMNALTRPLQRAAEVTPEAELGLGDADAGVWRAVPRLLPRLCEPAIAQRRRANYSVLLDALSERVPEPFQELPDGASPFAFPLDSDDKPALLERLAAHGVVALNLWSMPHPSLPGSGFPDAERRRRRTVGLPVHQELRPADLERIIDAAA
jgi:dTDP-4-amino-4,6-dideoxygalactose transaminase